MGKTHQGMPDPIHIKASHEGKLHTALHVPQGKPIPLAKEIKAEHSKNKAVAKEARFAVNERHFHHK